MPEASEEERFKSGSGIDRWTSFIAFPFMQW